MGEMLVTIHGRQTAAAAVDNDDELRHPQDSLMNGRICRTALSKHASLKKMEIYKRRHVTYDKHQLRRPLWQQYHSAAR